MNQEQKDEALRIYQLLSAPFQDEINGIVYPSCKWLPKDGKSNRGKITCFPYVTGAQVKKRLNSVLGLDGWMSEMSPQPNGAVFTKLSCYIAGKWIDKTDVGVESRESKEKGAATDSLKRAAVSFGVGAYLHKLGPKTIDAKDVNGKMKPIDKDGNVLYGDNLSRYLNGISSAKGLLLQLMNMYPYLRKNEDKRILSLWNELK